MHVLRVSNWDSTIQDEDAAYTAAINFLQVPLCVHASALLTIAIVGCNSSM